MNLDRAIQIAVAAHAGQTERNGQPYILHSLRVMMSLEGEAERIVGVLHDVVEDTDVTFDDLAREGFSSEVLDALRAVTKTGADQHSDVDEAEAEARYLGFVARAKADPIARRVKRADLLDNLNAARLPSFGKGDFKRIQRYSKALLLIDSLS